MATSTKNKAPAKTPEVRSGSAEADMWRLKDVVRRAKTDTAKKRAKKRVKR